MSAQNININAILDAETVVMEALTKGLADFGKGFVGAPRLKAGKLEGLNAWWLQIGGGPTQRLANAPLCSMDMDARIDSVWTDRARGWQFAVTALALLPIKGGNVQTCYQNGNPTNELEFFEIAGREGTYGLWRVQIPLRVVMNAQKG